MLFNIISLVFVTAICSYFYVPLCSVIDVLYASANGVVIASGGVTSVQTVWAWHILPVAIVGAVIFGLILFVKNAITNRNNQGQ
jgi:hypothetical protein